VLLGAAMHDRTGTVLPLTVPLTVRVTVRVTVPLTVLDRALADRWTLTPLAAGTGGPARYLRVGETGGRLGVI